MVDIEHMKTKDQDYILAEVQKLSAKIVEQQAKADKEGFKTYGGALGLADLERDRGILQGLLAPLRLVSDNGVSV